MDHAKSTIADWSVPVATGLVFAYLGYWPVQVLVGFNSPVAAVITVGLTAALVWMLARRVAPGRRVGWALVVVGLTVAAYLLSALAPALVQDSPLPRDERAALGFFMIIFGIPGSLVSLVLITVGVVKLRRGRVVGS